MREREPVRAVGEEGRSDGRGGQGEMDAEDPVEERRTGAEVHGAGEMIEQPFCFAHKGEGSQAAEQKTDHDNRETKADPGDEVRALGRADLGRREHVSGMPRGARVNQRQS